MTNAQMIRKSSNTTNDRLYIAFELASKNWKIMFSNGVKRRCVNIAAGDLASLQLHLKKSLKRFALAANVPIHSCYEAGRDGFWLHRYLVEHGIFNVVVDSASIEVNRRYRRAKTDQIDVNKLTDMLIRYVFGEQKLWSVLRVPSVEQEDNRRLNREATRLKKERTAHTNRIKSMLALHGLNIDLGADFEKRLDELVQYNGAKLPIRLKQEIVRQYQRYLLVVQHLKELTMEQKQLVSKRNSQANKVHRLQELKGIGPVTSWNLVYEFFGWRDFKNVKQVGAASGLAPTPYSSGDNKKEQGISKAGNRLVRTTMIETAWLWLRYQPNSKLSRWFGQRFASGGKRMRRVGIVALARKLLIALWKYLQKAIVPEGAVLKTAR